MNLNDFKCPEEESPPIAEVLPVLCAKEIGGDLMRKAAWFNGKVWITPESDFDFSQLGLFVVYWAHWPKMPSVEPKSNKFGPIGGDLIESNTLGIE